MAFIIWPYHVEISVEQQSKYDTIKHYQLSTPSFGAITVTNPGIYFSDCPATVVTENIDTHNKTHSCTSGHIQAGHLW